MVVLCDVVYVVVKRMVKMPLLFQKIFLVSGLVLKINVGSKIMGAEDLFLAREIWVTSISS